MAATMQNWKPISAASTNNTTGADPAPFPKVSHIHTHNIMAQVMTSEMFDQLERALEAAKKEMLKYADTEDGGTCNFDTPVIRVKATEKMMSQAEYRLVKVGEKGWQDCWFVFLPLYGQGNRRTRMAEAAARSLIASGFEAGVYYQMD